PEMLMFRGGVIFMHIACDFDCESFFGFPKAACRWTHLRHDGGRWHSAKPPAFTPFCRSNRLHLDSNQIQVRLHAGATCI
ncbi:hypothetical protein, partial [Eggerthella sp. BIOML-A5]|uniref:hypothetical protein n=1 Tax=Eggerthella sp. BIOML-A5 TaxID=2584642 RepID=UPI00195A34E3